MQTTGANSIDSITVHFVDGQVEKAYQEENAEQNALKTGLLLLAFSLIYGVSIFFDFQLSHDQETFYYLLFNRLGIGLLGLLSFFVLYWRPRPFLIDLLAFLYLTFLGISASSMLLIYKSPELAEWFFPMVILTSGILLNVNFVPLLFNALIMCALAFAIIVHINGQLEEQTSLMWSVLELFASFVLGTYVCYQINWTRRLAFAARQAEQKVFQWYEQENKERMKAESALSESEENINKVFEASPFPMLLARWDNSSIIRANRSALEFFNDPQGHILGSTLISQKLVNEQQWLMLLQQFKMQKFDEFESQLETSDQQSHWVIMRAFPIEYFGETALILGITDITTRKQAEERLKKLATTDPLTGACNRRSFMDFGHDEIKRTQRYQRPLSVLLLDIDHFKNINDTHGHAVGDVALKALTKACQAQLRETDMFGRIGGEEFSAILPEAPQHVAVEVAERLRRTLSELEIPLENGQKLQFTVSIGVAGVCPQDRTIDTLLNRADMALYQAKESGRNRVVKAPDPAPEPAEPSTKSS